MRRVIELCRVVLVSGEGLWIGVTVLLWIYAPHALQVVGKKFSNDEVWKMLLAVPPAILVWSLTTSTNVLFPARNGSNNALLKWPSYWKLKLRVVIAIAWCTVGCLSSLIIFFFRDELLATQNGAIFLAGIGVSLFAAGSMWLASINIRELTERK